MVFTRFSLMIALVICLSSALPATLASPLPSSEPVYNFHKMTIEDIDGIRAAFGVRDSSTDYNVLVNGFGTGLAPPTEEQLLAMVGSVNVLDSIEADFEALPGAVDLSVLPTFPAVGNQASQPSCAAWAAAYYAYGFLESVDNDWTLASSGEPGQLISPAWTYSRANNGRDSGSGMEENLIVVRDWGAATMQTMPFDEHEYLDLGSASAFREAPAHRADEVFHIDYTGASTIDEIKLLVSEGTPVTFGIDANEFSLAFADSNFIISSDEYSSISLNHAQTVVGYDDTVTDDGDVGAFWVVNSWGSDWGDEGFYWFTYETMMELGILGLSDLNYISDIEDYSPELVASWHFNDAPSRSASLELGIGPSSSPLASKSPFFTPDRVAAHQFPTYMCLDITEFAALYESSSEEFFLDIGPSSSRGTISSFKVTSYSGDYVPGVATRTSGQSDDVPRSTPATVTVSLPRYDAIDAGVALDSAGLELFSESEVEWVAVLDSSASDEASMQSGDVADGECTSLALSMTGPATITFSWRVSSENGDDILSFAVPDSDVYSSATGEAGWSEETHSLGEGTQTMYWNYTKGPSISAYDDTAWLDAISIGVVPPEFSMEESYDAVYNEALVVTPFDIVNPSHSTLDFWYDWGDDSSVTKGNPAEGYSASHTYTSVGNFDMTLWLSDEYDNNVSESAIVHVRDENEKPVADSMTISPASEYYSPGDSIRFDVEVTDTEGDSVTVTLRIAALGVEMTEVDTPEPDTPMVFSFDYTCPESAEAPYIVVAEVSDDVVHFDSDWDTVQISLIVNTPPVASLIVDVQQGDTQTVFEFDASGSSDAETSAEELEARWDWDGDGNWDTDWSVGLEESHQFLQPGSYTVFVEIRDGSGLTSTDSVEVEVGGEEAIPEFSILLVPVLAVLISLIAVSLYRKKRRDAGPGAE